MNIKVDFDNIVVKEDKNDFNVKVLMLKGEKGDQGDGEPNVIEKVQVNGTDLPVTNKTVNVPVPTVDTTLSSSSTNPVQNKIIYNALSDKVDNSDLNNYYEVSEVDALLSQKPYYFDSVAEMKAYNLQEGDYVITKGYYNSLDGGKAEYIIKLSSDIIHETLDNNLVAQLISNEVNVKQFGAYGDNTHDDSTAFQNAIDFVKNCNYTNTLIVPPSVYFIDNTLNVPSNIRIIGDSKSLYHNYGVKSSVLYRNRNIKLLNLSGKPFNETSGDVRANDILIEDLTLVTSSNEYYDEPLIYTKRAIYNEFNRLVFRGNGKAIFMDLASFDSKFINCDFVGNCDVETAESITDEYHNEIYYGINQMHFYSCRWEGFDKGNLIKLNNYTREIFFFAPKIEGTPSDGNPIISTINNNGDIYMYGARITILNGGNTFFAEFNNLSRSLFEVSYIDNSVLHDNALIKINNTSSINMLFKPSLDINNYGKDYYIENINSNTCFSIESTLIDLPYYSNAKKLYSNPVTMQKTNILLDNVYSSGAEAVNQSVKMKIRKETENSPLEWNIKPSFYNFNNNISQLIFADPNNDICMTLRNGGIFTNKTLRIPYLNTQPSSVSSGDILVNNYTDTDTPNLTIGVNNSSKRIGWGANAPIKGYWLKGNIVYNSNPSPGGDVGWICTATGTPGTWKSIGTIAS